MKKILAILILIQVQMTFAGMRPPFVMSPFEPNNQGSASSPRAGQDFSLWRPIMCSQLLGHQVIILGNEISLFEQFSSVSGSPCPTNYESVETINGLNEGLYDFNYYLVPNTDAFPPDEVDYPSYLVYQNQFQISQALQNVDTLSLRSLLAFSVGLLLMGFVFIRKKL